MSHPRAPEDPRTPDRPEEPSPPPAGPGPHGAASAAPGPGVSPPVPAGPHDVPSAARLVAAVRDFLESDVLPAVEGRVRFHTRVAANVLGMVERELELGPGQAAAHAARLGGLGFASDAELAAAVREGLDHPGLVAALTEAVRDKLAVANPAYLDG
ncbi:DUF6285 domain-containing protein [Planomonospora venezuelensis]|uniref:DUF6285 domain-containing protein n=1 Tax=Planomonospora venezuelensis TaxID=1999 RepID=A0A841DF67_PLAVE|nr:DUF6285 domain-containing protein [Planomonospora venezuelensis]MBB5967044.1 hypothetical protein [Planomonospora venezuelensis]GIN01486.1 hypothetical protein Pve01_31440 [Planomonospora venezuelensis]